MLLAGVHSLAVDSLRRRDDDFSDRNALLDYDLVHQRSTDSVDRKEPREVGQIVLVCSKVDHILDPFQCLANVGMRANIADLKFGVRGQPLRRTMVEMYGRRQSVQDAHPVATF